MEDAPTQRRMIRSHARRPTDESWKRKVPEGMSFEDAARYHVVAFPDVAGGLARSRSAATSLAEAHVVYRALPPCPTSIVGLV